MSRNATTEDPLISVIIPAYNMGQYVLDAVSSVIDQQTVEVEVIIVDDGSTDQTADVIKPLTDKQSSSYSPLVRYLYQENQGKSAAMNWGLTQAQGTYVAFLDADDEFAPGGLDQAYTAACTHHEQGADMVIGSFEVFNGEKTFGVRRPPAHLDPQRLRKSFYLTPTTPFHLNSCLLSRDLIQKVGLFDIHLRRCVDGDYAMRLLAQAQHVVAINDVVLRYRKHRSSRRERVRYRLQTTRYRPVVLKKQFKGIAAWFAIGYGLVLDMGKLCYELADSYKK